MTVLTLLVEACLHNLKLNEILVQSSTQIRHTQKLIQMHNLKFSFTNVNF